MARTTSYLKRQPKALQDTITPPMATRSRSSSTSSLSSFDDEAYFSKTYVPLSSLPTPPLSSFSRQLSPLARDLEDAMLDSELLGPAIHLTNLIPPSTSLTTPSVPIIHSLLLRTSLPLSTLALAVCILDSLNSRFALSWRKACPLVLPTYSSTWSSSPTVQEQHIDSVRPEIVVLAALVLAVKFVDDVEGDMGEYVQGWGRGVWTGEQVNFTQRVLLENLGYRLLPLWEEDVIQGALEDMERAGKQAKRSQVYADSPGWGSPAFGGSEGLGGGKGMSPGHAVKGLANLLTPAETPMPGGVHGTGQVEEETRNAFKFGRGDTFQLPDRTRGKGKREPFPEYDDPWKELGNSAGWGEE